MSLRRIIWLGGALLVVLIGISTGSRASASILGTVTPKWSRDLPADTCGADTNCHYGAPVLANINGDAFLDVVAVTNNGHVVAYNHNGSRLWDKDIAPAFGMNPGKHEIHSSPAVADIDNDGTPEIVVGAGTINPTVCTQGGLIVLSHDGKVETGWPYLAVDNDIPPAGCRDTIFSSPALGDLDNDGDLEIVAAGFDKRIYAWHHDGTLVAGFPPDSYLSRRFPTWPNLYGQLADLTWSSAALMDLDRDGYLDIVIGTGEGNFDASWGGDAGGWTCPYAPPPGWPQGSCGGTIYAFDRFGNVPPGFPQYVLEAIGSSAAVADVNDDAYPEIFIGTSTFFHTYSPDKPTYGFRLFGMDNDGDSLPGWSGGRVTGGTVPMSPAIGDITGDGELDIVVIAADRKLYAWHQNGSQVSGFPMTPLDAWGSNSGPFDVHRGLLLADYDGDGAMEIIFGQGSGVTVVDGNGQQLTAVNFPNNTLPFYYTEGVLLNTPAVGDIDNDGELELVAANSKLYVWDLPGSKVDADWPMFKQNAARTSFLDQPTLAVFPANIAKLHKIADSSDVSTVLQIKNIGSDSFNWTATEPGPISVTPNGGTVSGEANSTVTIPRSALTSGSNNWTISVQGTVSGQAVAGSPRSIPVTIFLVDEIYNAYLPLVRR